MNVMDQTTELEGRGEQATQEMVDLVIFSGSENVSSGALDH